MALIAVLEAIDAPAAQFDTSRTKQLICVANTHIHANPELNDVKLWQVHTLLKGLEKIANRWVLLLPSLEVLQLLSGHNWPVCSDSFLVFRCLPFVYHLWSI